MKLKIITCTGNYRKEKFFKIIQMICNFFEENNLFDNKIELRLSNEHENNIDKISLNKNIKIDTFDNCIKDSDLIMSIGGDGTILSTVRKLSNKSIPILGIHIGNLGFLAQSTEQTLIDALKCLINNDYTIEEKLLLKATIKDKNRSNYYAFNDIVIDHGNSGRILKTRVFNNDDHINNYEGDGIIICTPTGSTGYSLSSGGPIVHSNLDVITITPISSHSLSARPIVLPSSWNIKVDFPDLFIDASLTIDGQSRIVLSKDNIISISKAEFKAKLIVLPFYNYLNTLKEKLHWSGNSR
jgi:NAD+ kinase